MEIARSGPADVAERLFREGYACSQAVLLAFAPRFGLDADLAARVASAFGGGMARHGWTCGALTGALMAVGLHAGNAAADGQAQKDDAYARVATLLEQFRTKHGATECRRLIGFDLADAVQRQAASDAGVFANTCPLFVRTAAALVAETLDRPPIGTADAT